MAIFYRLALIFSALLFCARANAQGIGLLVSASPNPVVVSNQLSFTITVTNQSGTNLQNVLVSNLFSSTVQFTLTNSSTTNGNFAVANFGDLATNTSAQQTLTIRPLTNGFLTNFVTVTATNVTDVASTNVTVFVINSNAVLADVGVSLGGFPPDIFSNDQFTYHVTVTNAGPHTANVTLTNSYSVGAEFLGLSPSNPVPVLQNGFIILKLGNVTNGTSRNFQLTFQVTNSGTVSFSASVNSTNTLDPNPANNSALTNLTVADFLAGTGNLIAFTSSSQVFNRQTGRLQQIVTLSNTSPTTAVEAARLIVSGLTNFLFNAVGTNDGNPFVVHGAQIGPTNFVNLTLQFFPNRSPFPFDDSQLHPVEITPPDLSVPADLLAANMTNAILLHTNISSGVLIEFAAKTNRTYTMAYSDDLSSTNWRVAQPPFHTSANFVLWTDYGPPETLSNSPSRFYRVYLNP